MSQPNLISNSSSQLIAIKNIHVNRPIFALGSPILHVEENNKNEWINFSILSFIITSCIRDVHKQHRVHRIQTSAVDIN